MKKMNEEEWKNLKNLEWKNYPKNFQNVLFDFCILMLKTSTYSKKKNGTK